MREDEMDDQPDLDPGTEAAGRRLLSAAFDTAPADSIAHGDLARRVRRRTTRRRRVRTLVPAGVVAAVGGVAALVVTLTVASAPSALAAVTAAALKTSAQSFRVTAVQTQVNTLSAQDNGPPLRTTGVFDPGRGLGVETVAGSPVRIVDGHIYVELTGPGRARTEKRISQGKPWIEGLLWLPLASGSSLDLSQGFNGDEPVDPAALLGVLTSAASVRAEGPASGPGWTGARYGFTEPPLTGQDVTPVTVRGTVYVDSQGRVRRLVTTQTRPIWSSSGVKGSATNTFDVTFGEFGVPVSAQTPPASQVDNLGQEHLAVNELGGLVFSGPHPLRPAQR